MFLNYLKNLINAKPVTYEYALSDWEVKEALFQVSRKGNKQQEEFDVIGYFISETEFKYNLINIFDTNGIGITFPMHGTITPIDEKRTKIILQPRIKPYALGLFSVSGLMAITSLVLFFINGEIKFLFWFLAIAIIAPLLLRLYISSVKSALLIRYKKFLHNAILEAYRSKNYNL